MTWTRLLRAELRKLTTTRMPWAFLVVLVAMAGINAAVVIGGTDFDGTKSFLATAADQQSLVAFASNATVLAGLFGAMAVAREYAHGTVIPTFLSSPRRHRAVLAQYGAIAVGGTAIGLAGAALTNVAVAASLPTTDFGFLIPPSAVVRVLGAAAFAGMAGALLGAGIGTVVRNPGGAVTGAVLALIVAPPLIVQMANEASAWVPAPLATALSGVSAEAAGVGSQAGPVAAVVALAAWALVPALVGLVSVQRRDVV
ncbi:MAG: hypothetical protein AB1673_10245 [Actinomycetota bacterium]|jgi:ABC-2 type transport system permease protein